MKNNIDLSKLSIEELQALKQEIESEVVNRREAEKEKVLNQMRELAGSLGMSLEELVRQEGIASGGGGAPAAVKYRHPENPALTWSGRGKRPSWLNEALSGGKGLEDFAV
jgi:DNA-binding protein H-NS